MTVHITNMASIKQRRATWYAVYYIDGAYAVKTTGIKVAEDPEGIRAKQQAELMEQSEKNPALFKRPIPTIREYIENYQPLGKPTSISNHKRAGAMFLAFLGPKAKLKLDMLSTADCSDFLKEQISRVSYGTIRNYRALLSAELQQAVRDEIIPRNPFFGVQLHRMIPISMRKTNQREPFTISEMRTILTHFPEPWNEMAAVSFFLGGQRLGDVCNLKWSDVDLQNRVVSFSTEKTGRFISHPINDALYALLTTKRKRNGKDTYVFQPEHNAYFIRKGELSCQFTNLLKSFRIIRQTSARTKNGRAFSEKSFHSIRHTVVSLLRNSGKVSADLCREIVGHDSEDIERVYYHSSHDDKLGALSYLESILK